MGTAKPVVPEVGIGFAGFGAPGTLPGDTIRFSGDGNAQSR